MTIQLVTVTYECDGCGGEWEEEYPDLLSVDEDPDHPDCDSHCCPGCGCWDCPSCEETTEAECPGCGCTDC